MNVWGRQLSCGYASKSMMLFLCMKKQEVWMMTRSSKKLLMKIGF